MFDSFFWYLGMLASLVVAWLLWKLVDHVVRVRRVNRTLRKFPSSSPNCHWLLGNLLEFPGLGEEGIKYYEQATQRNPRCETFFGPTWKPGSLYLWHPETVRGLLRSAAPKFIRYGSMRLARGWVGEGLIMASGPKWTRSRKLLTPAFHLGALRHYVPITNACCDVLLDKIEFMLTEKEEKEEKEKKNERNEVKGEGGLQLEVGELFRRLTFDVILRSVFSQETNVQVLSSDEVAYAKAVRELTELWMKRALHPLSLPDWFYHLTGDGKSWKKNVTVARSFCSSIIQQRRAEENHHVEKRENSLVEGECKKDKKEDKNEEKEEKEIKEERQGNREKDLLDVLLGARDEDGRGLSDEEVLDEVNVFVFAGSDTTANALAWSLHSLGGVPQHQATCRREVDALFSGRSSDHLNSEDLHHLPFLTMCIKESLRLHSIVPWLAREVDGRGLEVEGRVLEEHTLANVLLVALHRNPAIWPDPLQFDPERFSPEKVEQMHPYQFLPFSAGPRNCIGQHFAMNELKVILARLLHRFVFRLDADKPSKHLMQVVMTSQNGVHLIAQRRP